MIKVHDYKMFGNGEVYDRSQCDDTIKSGDIILTSEAILVMCDAWPVALAGSRGSVHTLTDIGQENFADSIQTARGLPEWEDFKKKWVR